MAYPRISNRKFRIIKFKLKLVSSRSKLFQYFSNRVSYQYSIIN